MPTENALRSVRGQSARPRILVLVYRASWPAFGATTGVEFAKQYYANF